jgi:hypothetical protein
MDDDPLAVDFHCSHILAAVFSTSSSGSVPRRGADLRDDDGPGILRPVSRAFRCPDDSMFKVVASPFDYSARDAAGPGDEISEPSDAQAHTEELLELLPSCSMRTRAAWCCSPPGGR